MATDNNEIQGENATSKSLPELDSSSQFSSADEFMGPTSSSRSSSESETDTTEDDGKKRQVISLVRTTKLETSSIVITHKKYQTSSLLISVCQKENYSDFDIKSFIKNILSPILAIKKPFKFETIHLFVGSITTDRPLEDLTRETKRDKDCKIFFENAIKEKENGETLSRKVKRKTPVSITIHSWFDIASRPAYRDLYQYVREECANGEIQRALVRDAIKYLSRRYPEGSEASKFIHEYKEIICRKGFEGERHEETLSENTPFTSERGIKIERDIVAQLLQWEKEDAYDNNGEAPISEIVEIDISQTKINQIVTNYRTEHPEANEVEIEKVAKDFLLTLRYLMREIAGFLEFGDIMFNTVFCRDQKPRPWLESMRLIHDKNQGAYLITEELVAKMEIIDPAARKARRAIKAMEKTEKGRTLPVLPETSVLASTPLTSASISEKMEEDATQPQTCSVTTPPTALDSTASTLHHLAVGDVERDMKAAQGSEVMPADVGAPALSPAPTSVSEKAKEETIPLQTCPVITSSPTLDSTALTLQRLEAVKTPLSMPRETEKSPERSIQISLVNAVSGIATTTDRNMQRVFLNIIEEQVYLARRFGLFEGPPFQASSPTTSHLPVSTH